MKFIKIGDFVINTDFVESVTLNKVGTEVEGVRLFMAESRLKGEWLVIKNETLDSMLEKLNRVPDSLKVHAVSNVSNWQPDWSQAPKWANWWAMDGFSKKANWYIDKPYLDDDSEVELEWNIDLKTNTGTYTYAPSFNYQGDWKDSLRKRPEGK